MFSKTLYVRKKTRLSITNTHNTSIVEGDIMDYPTLLNTIRESKA